MTFQSLCTRDEQLISLYHCLVKIIGKTSSGRCHNNNNTNFPPNMCRPIFPPLSILFIYLSLWPKWFCFFFSFTRFGERRKRNDKERVEGKGSRRNRSGQERRKRRRTRRTRRGRGAIEKGNACLAHMGYYRAKTKRCREKRKDSSTKAHLLVHARQGAKLAHGWLAVLSKRLRNSL